MAEFTEIVLLVLEAIWTIIKVNAENLRSIYKVFLPNEPKDVRGEIVIIMVSKADLIIESGGNRISSILNNKDTKFEDLDKQMITVQKKGQSTAKCCPKKENFDRIEMGPFKYYITGAGHGMGREMAVRFAKLGAIVVCVDINPTGNEETVKMIQESGGNAHRYECDVTDRAAVFNLAEKVKKEVGEVSILVNNAGIMPSKPLLEWTEQKIRSTIDVNLTANLWMIQAFLPSMKDRNHGHIVAMSSMAGLIGFKNLVPYCGSKFAVRGVMEALESELFEETEGKSQIKFTTICPYMVNTGLCKNPRIRFQDLMKMVDPGEAADLIIDAVRRDVLEISIPGYMHYATRYARLLATSAGRILNKFVDAGVEAHD